MFETIIDYSTTANGYVFVGIYQPESNFFAPFRYDNKEQFNKGFARLFFALVKTKIIPDVSSVFVDNCTIDGLPDFCDKLKIPLIVNSHKTQKIEGKLFQAQKAFETTGKL